MTWKHTFISTPSHGYLMVSEKDYNASGYKASKYSYYGNGFIYLEEDCDAPAFLRERGETFDNASTVHREADIICKLRPMSGKGYISPFDNTTPLG